MTRAMLRTAVMAGCLTGSASAASAQETVGEIVNFLVTNRAVETNNFERDRAAAEQASATIAQALLLNLTTVPLVSSSSGFLYRLNPELGTMERATESFGSFFVERALTAGRGRASFGVSGFTSTFDRLGDLNLRDGSMITVANQFRDEPRAFNTEALTLRVRSATMTVFGNVGVTDRLEIGAALPFVQLTIDGQRINAYREEAPVVQASGQATARGIGDAAVRAKYTVAASSTAAVAAAAEVRLPTGNESNLLGTGAAAYRFMGIGSVESGRLTLHGNGGWVFGGVSDEINFAGAAAFAVQPRVTLSAEMLFRRIDELSEVQLVSERHPTIAGVDTQRLVPALPGATISSAVAGIKWNVGRSLVLGAHVAFPLVRRGLTAPLTPTIGMEYAFD